MKPTLKRGPSNLQRLTSVAIASTLLLAPVQHSQASMDDFLDAAGAQYNVTPGGVYQSATARTVTGGGFVFKAPQRTFTPFGFVPPSLKAGCGGIDFFGGAMSLPSKAEFMNFLRGVGTAIPGLAFELALKNLSPDFAEEVKAYWTKFQEIANGTISSCEAAQALLDTTGVSDAIKGATTTAQSWLRSSSGGAADGAEAREKTRADFRPVENAYAAKTPQEKQGIDPTTGLPSGFTQDDIEMNLMWSVINSGKYSSMTTEEKEELMTLVGTVIYRKANSATGDPDNMLKPVSVPAAITSATAAQLLGRIDKFNPAASTAVKRLSCGTDITNCLTPSPTTVDVVGVAQRVFNAARKIQQGILSRTRNSFTQDDMFLLTSYSSVPLLPLIQSTAFTRYEALSSDILMTFSEVAAYEIVLNYMDDVLSTLRKSLQVANDKSLRPDVQKYAQEYIKRIEADLEGLRAQRQELNAKISVMRDTQQWIEHVESRLRQSLSEGLRRNLTFANALARG